MSKYIDEIFALQKEKGGREVTEFIFKHFYEKIEGILIRYHSLDAVEIKNYEYNSLVMEARELYFQGFYHSCVVMSCSIAEHILRYLLFENVQINMKHLSKETQKYLSFIKAKTICEFLASEHVIQKSLLSSFKILGELRNKYANITATSPKEDAKRSLYHLHKILRELKVSGMENLI